MTVQLSVVLDACVLIPIRLCDLLLRLADEGLYQPLWTDEICGDGVWRVWGISPNYFPSANRVIYGVPD